MKKQKIYLIRHGETAWTKTGKHTGLTDLPLTDKGKKEAVALKPRLQNTPFAKVWTSPLGRAKETCALAGFTKPEIEADLMEWNYGSYEGLTLAEIQRQKPGWELFKDGAPDGETVSAISQRADRMLQKIASVSGDVALFSSGHISRVLAARFLGLPASQGRLFMLCPAALSILSYEHDVPVILLWNEV